MTTIRSFLAIPLDEPLKNHIAALQRRLRTQLPDVRWSPVGNLHLTLRFFGDIPEEWLEKIGESMLSIGRLHAAFALRFSGLGAFPDARRARVLWLGTQDRGELARLHADLEDALAKLGIEAENRPFAPHLTLGRSRGKPLKATGVLDKFSEEAPLTLAVDTLVLYESRLERLGALHIPRAQVALGN